MLVGAVRFLRLHGFVEIVLPFVGANLFQSLLLAQAIIRKLVTLEFLLLGRYEDLEWSLDLSGTVGRWCGIRFTDCFFAQGSKVKIGLGELPEHIAHTVNVDPIRL